MKILICISGRTRISNVTQKVQFLLTEVPKILRSHGIEPVCSINWAHEPRLEDENFMKDLQSRGLVSYWSWTPTFLGVGEVMFDTIFTAFQATADDSVEFAVHLPTDSAVDANLPGSVLGNLHRLWEPLKSSPRPDLVLGDYTPLDRSTGEDDSVKTGIETHVRDLVKCFFPNEWAALETVRRPRSEFFIIHRRFFEHLTTANALWSAFDPTVIALIEAARNPEWAWMSADLGNFYEDQRRDVRAIVRQIHRTTYVLSTYWLQTTDATGLAANLADRLPQAIELEQESLKSIAKW